MLILLDQLNKDVKTAYERYDFIDVTTKLTNFMTNELSSYYCDFAKDILYIELLDSKRRRQVQSVLYQITDTLVRLWSPVLCYTMEEVWQFFKEEGDLTSVHYTHFADDRNYADSEKILEDFKRLNAIRDDVLKALELARNEKLIGKSLEAEVLIHLNKDDEELVKTYFKDKVHQWLIVSKVTFSEDKLDAFDNCEIKILKAQGHVCPRCWNYTQSDNEDGLCDRCKEVMAHLH